jgi:hypothetical protein
MPGDGLGLLLSTGRAARSCRGGIQHEGNPAPVLILVELKNKETKS